MTSEVVPEVAAAAAGEADTGTDGKDEVPKEPEEEKKDEAAADVVKSVAERLKFFFSDANVRQDLFLRKLLMPLDKKENKDCSVPVEALLRFNTIKKYTQEPEVIVKAVREHLSEKLVVLRDGKAVARVKPFTKELVNENIPLSLYVANLPTKEEEGKYGKKQVVYDVTMEEIRDLFETYGEIALIKMRFKSSARSDDDQHTDDIKMEANPDGEAGNKKPRRRYPLESCMVEFENLEALGTAAEHTLTSKNGEKVEPKRKLEIGGKTLDVMLLKDYVDGLRKRKRDDDGNKKEEDDRAPKFVIDWKPGCVLSLKGLPEACDREAILDAVSGVLDLSKDELKAKKVYADFSRGQKDGALRFDEPDLATKMFEKLKSGDAKICDAKVEEVIVLEGDEEKKYWDTFMQFKNKQMRHRKEDQKHKHKRRKGPRK